MLKDPRFTPYKTEKGVEASMFEEDGVRCIRGVGEIELDYKEAMTILGTPNINREWDPQFDFNERIEVLPLNTFISHQKFKGKFGVQPREFIMLSQTCQTDEGEYLMVASSIEYPEKPPEKKVTRGKVHIGGWLITPDKESPHEKFYA